jgi:hypothetical protein
VTDTHNECTHEDGICPDCCERMSITTFHPTVKGGGILIVSECVKVGCYLDFDEIEAASPPQAADKPCPHCGEMIRAEFSSCMVCAFQREWGWGVQQ